MSYTDPALIKSKITANASNQRLDREPYKEMLANLEHICDNGHPNGGKFERNRLRIEQASIFYAGANSVEWLEMNEYTFMPHVKGIASSNVNDQHSPLFFAANVGNGSPFGTGKRAKVSISIDREDTTVLWEYFNARL